MLERVIKFVADSFVVTYSEHDIETVNSLITKLKSPAGKFIDPKRGFIMMKIVKVNGSITE